MSVLTPPLPPSVTELNDNRAKKVDHLATLLVTALVSNDPQGVVEAISSFIKYFTLLLEVIDSQSKKNNTTNLKGPHNI